MEALHISPATYSRLKSYAEPLVDTVDTVLNRVFDHWDKTTPARSVVASTRPTPAKPTHFQTAYGTPLPIGLEIFADYKGQRFTAKVTEKGIEYGGKAYEGPSPAAVAAKVGMGVSQKTASTNGWTFWHMTAPGKPGFQISLHDQFRRKR